MDSDPFGIVGTLQAQSFRVERAVAEGGFGVVYKAKHEAFRAPVALKCLKVPASLTGAQREAFLEKFREEAELMFRLSANIQEVVRPLHFGLLETPDRFVPFLALEWLDGETLESAVSRRAERGKAPISVHALVPLLAPLARALAKAHRFPGDDGPVVIVHRDLKPENVFLVDMGGKKQPKILDFGIARVRSASNAIAGNVTSADAMQAFSPAYAAPEQWDAKRFGAAGPWTDVYGLAITMTEALLGRPPLEGPLATLATLALDPAVRPSPRALGAIVPAGVEDAFVAALAVDPRDRTGSIEAFWTALEEALGLPLTFGADDDDDLDPQSTGDPGAHGAGVAAAIEAARGRTAKPSPPRAAGQAPTVASQPEAPVPKVPSLAPPPMAPPSKPARAPAPLSPVAADATARVGDAPRSYASGLDAAIPRSAPRTRPVPFEPFVPVRQHASGAELSVRLSGPAKLLVVGMSIGAADFYLHLDTGAPFEIAGIRLLWGAIGVSLLAILWGLARLVSDD